MAEKSLKTITFEGLKHIYTIPETPEDIGAAPAGYGLGYEVQTAPDENPDNIVGTGFYRCSIPLNGSQAWWIGTHEQLYADNSFAYQRFTSYDRTFPETVQRFKMNGTWGEWEWENPPMVLGVEYRTTERYNGKPVYTKLIYCGVAKNAGGISWPSGFSVALRHAGWLGTSIMLPCGDWVGKTGYYAYTSPWPGGSGLNIYTDSLSDGLGNYDWYEQVWYTKS